jgi:hypothetical protein
MPFDDTEWPPREPIDPVRAILERALEILRRRGITFGTYQDDWGRVCSARALQLAAADVGAPFALWPARCRLMAAAGVRVDGKLECWHDDTPTLLELWWPPARRERIRRAFERALAG